MIETRIAGIPCGVVVTSYSSCPGSYSYNAASRDDYYGYTDCEWYVVDRKGYKADWLAKKLTPEDEARINEEIEKYARDYV